MFFGETAINLDVKGRLAIPTRYREQIQSACGNQLVLTYNPYDSYSLWLYPENEWERVRDTVMELSTFNPDHRWLQRSLVGSAAPVEPDGNGRILIPQTLRQVANLEKRATLLGLGSRFEVWNEDVLNSTRQQRAMQGPTAGGEPSEEMSLLRL